MPVTRTGKQCPICGVAGVEEFGGMCASCYRERRIELVANRIWCNYCGHRRLVEVRGDTVCASPKCGRVLWI